jgi:DNA repair protein RadA/Sms
MEGRRPVAVEIQALVAPSAMANPRRTTSGIDASRLAMVLAVLQRRCGVSLANQDVYASTVGGARVTEPALDLTIALACASARWDLVVPSKTLALGEVGLGGQIRSVSGVGKRLEEAARLGMRTALVPVGTARKASAAGLRLIEVADVRDAMRALQASATGEKTSAATAAH